METGFKEGWRKVEAAVEPGNFSLPEAAAG
jgi:hypothetical protein